MAMRISTVFGDVFEGGTPAIPFQVGDWLVEPAIGRVSRGNKEAHLEPKVMQVLVCLAEHAGELVPKREITDAVWQVEYITDNRLNRAIADLRRALDDVATSPKYIETIPTRGYRLVAPVVDLEDVDGRDEDRLSPFKLEGAERGYALYEGENTIGRGTDVRVRVDSEWVSRCHARINVEGSRAFLEDLGSKNGTYLRGSPIDGRTELHDGDEITVGRGLMMLRFVTVLGSTRTEI